MTDISRHPLLKQAYDVCQAIECCGASPALTHAVTKASDLLQALDKFLVEPPKQISEPPKMTNDELIAFVRKQISSGRMCECGLATGLCEHHSVLRLQP